MDRRNNKLTGPLQLLLVPTRRMSTDKAPKYTAPFDVEAYSVHPDMAEIFKEWTGIRNDEELKEHLVKVSKDAFQRFRYPCISMFTHLKFPPTNLPSYERIKALGRHRKRHIFLEVGSGLGTEIRRIVYDGYPTKDVVATDILGGLWDMGHELFQSDASSFPVKFVEGDIFDNGFLSMDTAAALVSKAIPRLEGLESLQPLRGQVSIILIQQVFHLFSLERQAELAKRLLTLIKLEPGSIICGRQGGSIPEENCHTQGKDHYLHSPDSWLKMWESILPKSVEAKYCTEFRPLPADIEKAFYLLSKTTGYLTWSIEIV